MPKKPTHPPLATLKVDQSNIPALKIQLKRAIGRLGAWPYGGPTPDQIVMVTLRELGVKDA